MLRWRSKGEVVNALSFDVEDWYQVSDFALPVDKWSSYPSRLEGNVDKLLEILDEHGVRATFFVLSWNAERDPKVLRSIAEAGHEVASHGHSHHLIYEQTRKEFSADLDRSLKLIEDLAGRKVLGYRAPSFSVRRGTLWVLEVLRDRGLKYDSSIFPVHRGLYGMSDAPRHPHIALGSNGDAFWEFPPATTRWLGQNIPVSGGGYLRLLPYRVIRWGIRRINEEGQPAMVYLHPWELDPLQPRFALPGKWSTHYVKLAATEGKLRQLLADFHFAPVREILPLGDG